MGSVWPRALGDPFVIPSESQRSVFLQFWCRLLKARGKVTANATRLMCSLDLADLSHPGATVDFTFHHLGVE